MLSPNPQPLISIKCARLIFISLADITATHQHPSHTFALLFRWGSRVSCGAHGVTCSSWSGKKTKTTWFCWYKNLVGSSYSKSYENFLHFNSTDEQIRIECMLQHNRSPVNVLANPFLKPLKPHPIHALRHPHPPNKYTFCRRQLSCASKLRQFSERCPFKPIAPLRKS